MSERPGQSELLPFRAVPQQRWADLSGRPFRRILLIKPSAVGDVVRTLPVLAALRRRWPGAHITWLLARQCADLLIDHPALDEVLLFDRHRYAHIGRSISATGAFADYLRRLRGGRYDLVIDLQGLFRSGFFAWASGSSVRIGRADARELTGIFYTHRAAVDARKMHALVLNAAMVAPLGVTVLPSPDDLYIAAEVRQWAHDALLRAGLASGRPYVVLAPASNWPTKDWPAQAFGRLALRLRQRFDLRCVVVGTAKHADLAQVIKEIEPGAIDLTGKSSLRQLAALIADAALVVANDSGPLHMADALNKPLVGIFGPTRPEIVGPYNRPDGVVRADVECLCCGIKKLSRCPHDHRCMKQLGVETVLARAAEQLSRPQRRPPRFPTFRATCF